MSMKNDVFGKNGMLHRLIGDKYELREGQMRMAVAVAKAIRNRNHLLCEGATGIGKSFGYLIPAFSPAMRKVRAIVEGGSKAIILATSTKILQDQLIEADVPVVSKATDVNLKVHVAKGRNNYLSQRRLDNFQAQLEDDTYLFDDANAPEKAQFQVPALAKWWQVISDNHLNIDGEFTNFTKDIYEQVLKIKVDSKDEEHFKLHPEVLSAVQSDINDCLGKQCPTYQSCPYYTKRNKMENADLVIANHTLLALQLRYKTVLPEANTFIIDEAHKFYQAVSSVYEIDLSLQRVKHFLKAFINRWDAFRKNANAIDTEEITEQRDQFVKMAEGTESFATEFFDEYHQQLHYEATEQGRINEWTETYPYNITAIPHRKSEAFVAELQKYVNRCERFENDHFESLLSEDDPDRIDADLYDDYQNFLLIQKSAINIANDAESILCQTDLQTYCYWADIAADTAGKIIDGTRLKLIRTPINITKYLEPLFANGNSVILTSATLTTGNQGFRRLKAQLGLQDNPNVKEMVEPSPFPFKRNAVIHLFSDLRLPPKPSDEPHVHEAYIAQQAALCEFYLKLNHGSALVLCTSRYFMDKLYERMLPVLQEIGVNGLIQSDGINVKQLLSDFVSDETSVLFGVESCWEGLNAPGNTLKTLIITRLPFAPPHPVTDARINQLDDPTHGFRELILPEMLLRLKQGTGRLIRSMTDTGVIAILDPRAITKSYRRDIVYSLPPAEIVPNHQKAIQVLDSQNL